MFSVSLTLPLYPDTPTRHLNAIFIFTDDTTVMGLVTANREEVGSLLSWCHSNNNKTKDIIIGFMEQKSRNYKSFPAKRKWNESQVSRISACIWRRV